MREGLFLARRLLLYGVSLLLVQLAVGCSPENAGDASAGDAAGGVEVSAISADQDEIDQGDESRPLVVAFGDSLFAGYRLDPGEGLVPQLEQALATRGVDAQIFNAAVSGDTSAAGLQRLDFALDGLARKPDLVIVGLGGNDMLRGLDPEETRRNLEAILTRLHEREIDAMLSGMLASRNMGEDYAAAFDPIFPALAKQFDVPLYPFTLDGVIGMQDLMLSDGIHPNAEGAEEIAKRMAPIVATELSQKER